MTVTVLDTHEIVKKLKAAGFTEGQAEAVIDVVRDPHNINLSALATKTDLTETLAELLNKIGLIALATKAELAGVKADIAGTKAELLKWIVCSVGLTDYRNHRGGDRIDPHNALMFFSIS